MGLWLAEDAMRWVAAAGIRPGGPVDVELIDVGNPGERPPDMPDRVALIYPAPGTGESLDGVLDTTGFQLWLRWGQNDPLGAARAARMADWLIRKAAAACPMWAGDPADPTWLVWVGRSGGGPSLLGDPRDDGERTIHVTTYLTTVAEHAHEEMI